MREYEELVHMTPVASHDGKCCRHSVKIVLSIVKALDSDPSTVAGLILTGNAHT
jgi:bacterioferritin-associated ferredoxin